MKFVAFFRNVNLGQLKSPSRVQLESAYLEAGASAAASFMSNGSLVFSVARSAQALSTSRRACETLKQVCGLKEPAYVRRLSHLAALVSADPFAEYQDPTIYERCLTFLVPEAAAKAKPPIESTRKDCLIFHLSDGEAFSITRAVRGKAGYPTPVLEKLLKVLVTTRSWTTILRLVEKHA